MSLLATCEARYGLEGYTLRPLVGGVSDHTYALEHANADTLVLRVERTALGDIPTHERVLLFLEEREYPAPRVIRALDGSPFIEHEGWKLVVTTFVEGDIVEADEGGAVVCAPADLFEVGRMIGRLHA